MMKALVFHGVKDIKYEDVPEPVPQDGEVLIRVRASGICGSDMHSYTGKSDRRYPPMIMGHEFSGEVVNSPSDNFTTGDRVVIQPLLFCGECDMCKAGMTNICRNKSLFGVFSKNGAMAEFIAVPEKQILKIPGTMSNETASLMEPVAVAYGAATKASFDRKPRSKVIVIGCGTIGLCLIKLIKAMADTEVIALDVQEYRLSAARKMGADHCLDSSDKNIHKNLKELIPQGADIAFEAVGFGATVKLALENIGVNGQCIWVGNSAKYVEVNMQDVVVGMKTIKGSYAYTHDDFRNALAFAIKENLDFSPLISEVVPLCQGAEAFRRLATGKEPLIKVIITNT